MRTYIKISILAINVFVVNNLIAQATNTPSLSNNGGSLFSDHTLHDLNSVTSKDKPLTYEDINGTPYYDKFFKSAKFTFDNNSEIALARYNAYRDEVEFKRGDEILALKPANVKNIFFQDSGTTMVYFDGPNENEKGYFFELVNGNNSLYKKVHIKYNEFVPAANSYSSDKPANFSKADVVYYLKTKNAFIKISKNNRDFLSNFDSNKNDIKSFINSNKIKLENENDLIKLVNYLNK